MAGAAADLSSYVMQQPYQGTTSSTVNEVDVVGPFPGGTRYLTYYFTGTAGRVGHPSSGAKTTASTLVDGEPHKPMPADTWMGESYTGGKIYISSPGASVVYYVIPHPLPQ